MAPSHKLPVLAVLLACDVGTHAIATPPATPFLAAAKADKLDPAERKAKRAAKRAKADNAAKTKKRADAKKTADPRRASKHPQPAEKPPATPTATTPTTASAARLPACPTMLSPIAASAMVSCAPGAPVATAARWRSGLVRTPPEDVNFDRAALYKPHARDVYARSVSEAHAVAVDPNAAAAPMPPAGVVPEADRRRRAQWIACGSPGT